MTDSDPATDDAGGVSEKLGLDAAITAAFGDDEPSGQPEKPQVEAKPDDEAAATEGDEDAGETAKVEQAETDDASKPSEEEAAAPEPPQHWPEPDRQAFAKLPRDGQAVVLKLAKNLQAGFTRKSQELSDKARFADRVGTLFDEPLRAQMQQSGMDEAGVVQYLLALQKRASSDPVGHLKWEMQHLGVTPDQLFGPQTQQAPGQQQADPMDDLLRDPAVKQLEAEIAELREWRQTTARQQQEAQRSQYMSGVNTIQREIRSFREAQDDNGNLQYPHFDTVQKHMGALMDTDPDLAGMPDGQDKLKRAYDMAVHARPDLRQSFIDAEVQKRFSERERKADAAKAKTATAVKPAAAIVSSRPKKQSLDDIIADNLSKAGL